MIQFGNRIPVLQGSLCVITQMLWVNQVLYMGLQFIFAIMFHPAFHFEARTSRYASVALIIISAPLPLLYPVSLSCSLSLSPGRGVNPWGHDAGTSISGVCRWGIGNYFRFNAIFQIKTEELNEILQCYCLGRIGHSSVLPWWTDRYNPLTFYYPHATDYIWVSTMRRYKRVVYVIYYLALQSDLFI